MLICKQCFFDEELSAAVSVNSTTKGNCEVCHTYENVIDLSEFFDFFESLLSLFIPADHGKTVVDIIQDDWNLFRDKNVATSILSEVLANRTFGYSISDTVDYDSDLKDRVAVWERLKTSIKENFRFFIEIDEFAKYNYLQLGASLLENRKLYRSRIIPIGKKIIKKNKMGCPPKSLATAGRANPIGIPYLYLSDSVKTTYFEVRAVYLDKLSVGTFEVVRQQKLVDFVYNVNLYLSFIDGTVPLKEIIIRKKIIDAISFDLSKPLRRYDSELEYVPTQLICEYCRSQLNADGISFDSSLHKGGKNYVLFDQSAVRCTEVHRHEITKIDIE